MTRPVSLTIRARIGDADGPVVIVRGREAWALRMLMAAGDRGCTPIDHPGPRWSGYVHDLRKLGIVIETVHERHGGNYPGTHARYVLRSHVIILDQGGNTGGTSPANLSAIVREVFGGQSHQKRSGGLS
jgi:hypothetical protein